MKDHDAEELWHRFGSGDGSAFAQLYRDHHRDVFRYCRSLLHDEEDAHDAAQGTWTALWTTPGAARREIPLRPWLFRVAHNESVDILRRRRPHETLTDLELPALDDVAGDVELRDRLATLQADLLSLPERQRAALLLREIAGLGHAEIGDVFGTSAAAAKQTIYEARRALVDAEGGRTMACDLVQHAISDGDGRVRRGRRLRAHLRGCAACRAFADDVGRRRGDLHLLFPAPAALGVLARAGGERAAPAVAATPARVVSLGSAQRRVTPAVAAPVAPRPTARRGPAPKHARVAPRDTAPAVAAAPAASAPRVSTPLTPADHGQSAGAPGQVKKTEAVAVPPGQAKRTGATATPPGQAKRTGAVAVPPGQAKRTDAKPTPPGQAKRTEAAATPVTPAATSAPAVGDNGNGNAADAPGQAKADTPPGQAKR